MEQTAFTKKLEDQTVNEADTLKHECRLSKLQQRVLWRKNDKLVVQDGRITVIVDGHKHQLIIRDVMPEDAGYFSCAYGNVSTGCTLRVEELPLAFRETLKDQTVLEAADVTIGCRLSKPYQKVHWLTNSYLVPPYDRITIIADKFIHRLIIRDVTPEVSGAYRCVCDNVRTQCTLKVVSEGFKKTLKNNTAMETDTVTLECQLSKPYQTVKWTKNEEPVVQDGRITLIVDVHKHQLVIRNVTLEDAGNFSCVCHSAKTECTLQVEGFTKTLKNTTAMEAETVTLECQLSKPYQTVKWVRKEESVVKDGRISVIVDVHKHQLVIRNVTLEDAGNFSCVYHRARTECTLHVEELEPEFTRTLENQTVYSTITVTQECRLSKPNKTVQWVKNGQQMRFDDRISATVAIYTHRLIIKDVKMEDAGTYRCVYSNVSTQSTLTVEELPEENDWFDGERYSNWVKTSVSLCYMKEGITEFSNTKAAAFHKDIKERVSLRKTKASSTTCIQCTHKQARKTKGKDKNTTTWRMNCNMNICNVWLEEILPYHRHVAMCPNIEWKNSDPRLWPSDGWEIVKLFQPFGCKDQHKAEDSDATGLLTLLLDCSFFNKFMSNLQLLQKIKDVRNVCMHSKDLIMKVADMEQSLNLMMTFLGETELQKYQTAREAAAKIKQLRDIRLDVSLKKSFGKKVLKEKLTEVKHNITRLDDTDNNLRGGTGSMSAQQNTYLGDYRKRLKGFKDLFFEVETSLQNFIQVKDHAIEKTFTQSIYLIYRLQDIEQDNREVDEYYQPKMSTLNSEHQDVTSESQEQTEEPEERQLSVAAPAPCFSEELRNQVVYEKATATLECQLSKPNQTVRWLKGVTQVCSSDRITVEADTCTHKLIIRNVTLEDAGTFWCFCDNVGSSCTLEVNELASKFIKKLENHTILETLTATLVCQLSNPNKAVQWFNDDQQVISDDRITVTADEFTHQLTIRDLKLEDAGNFRCVSGDVSTHCTLTVDELAPDFIGKLDNRNEKEAQTVTLNCQLSRPNMKVQWSKADQQIISDARISVTVDIYYHRLVIRDVRMEDAGDYSCVCGSVSTRCTLNVEVVPELPVKFVNLLEDTQGYTKNSTTLSCELDRPYRTVTWTKGSKVLKSNDDTNIVSGIYTHQLVFPALTKKFAGKYTCSYGGVSTTAKLTVKIVVSDDDDQAARELWLSGKCAEDVRKDVLERSAVLQQLTLNRINLSSLGDQLSDVLTLQHLVHLTLGDITLSHEQCQNLDRDLRGSPQLRKLTLQDISCMTHGQESGCGELDLGGPLRLHGITLIELPFTRVVFNPEVLLRCVISLPGNVAGQVSSLQNLLAASNLQRFECYNVSDADAVSKLVDVLPQLQGLQQLTLMVIYFGSVADIRLSATMDQLESVELRYCKFDTAGLECLLQQHNLPQRRMEIELFNVTIRGDDDVISKIRQSPDTEVNWDRGVEYSDGEWEVGRFSFYTRK